MKAIPGDCFANVAIRSCFVDTVVEFQGHMVLSTKNGSMIRRLASLHWLQRGEVRQLRRYYQDAMTSCGPFRRTWLASLGDTWGHSFFRSQADESRQGREFVTRYLRPGHCRGGNRISQVPGEPRSSVCHVPYHAGRTVAPDHKVQQRGPWSSKGRGSHDWVFRRSIAWLSDSLFTLRRDRYLTRRKTRFQLLVRLYWTGFTPARFRERFQSCDYILSPFPKLSLADSMQPLARRVIASGIRCVATRQAPDAADLVRSMQPKRGTKTTRRRECEQSNAKAACRPHNLPSWRLPGTEPTNRWKIHHAENHTTGAIQSGFARGTIVPIDDAQVCAATGRAAHVARWR